MGKRRTLSILLVVAIVVSLFSNAFLIGPLVMFSKANPGDISNSWDNSTTLNVTVLQLEPRINWFDFQYNNSGTWESRLNQQIDVNNSAEYRFIVNISSDQGWADIIYINITAWYDNSSEATTYNQSVGGNKNLYLQWENTTGTANWTMLWPDDEVSFNSEDCSETSEIDPDFSAGNTDCYNVTFAFTPGYQFRYAPGDGAWNTTAGHNDLWSWNFNITAEDQAGNLSYFNPTKGESISEFGVYSYTEIVSAGWPTISGNPGTTVIATSNITLVTRSNGNYSLSVNLDQLDHELNPSANIANTTVSLRGGNLTSITPFPGTGPLNLWGVSDPDYQWAENDSTSKTTSDIEYRMAIPLAQIPGDYTGTLLYVLTTET